MGRWEGGKVGRWEGGKVVGTTGTHNPKPNTHLRLWQLLRREGRCFRSPCSLQSRPRPRQRHNLPMKRVSEYLSHPGTAELMRIRREESAGKGDRNVPLRTVVVVVSFWIRLVIHDSLSHRLNNHRLMLRHKLLNPQICNKIIRDRSTIP